jgi:NAD(P)-dependent dehydrogenase (short-subunit alcohol dehydrogenase family)
MDTQLKGRVALVTGGATGIGKACALALAHEGAYLIISGRREQIGEDAVREIRAAGGEVQFVRADVTRRADIESLIAQTLAIYGRLDFAVNNAGIEGPAFVPIADYPEEAWDEVLNTNLKGLWLSMKYEIPHLLKQPGSAIVNVSSVGGVNGSTLGVAYHASKHGVIGVTRAAAVEYGPAGLRVNAVAPGSFHTDLSHRLFPEAAHDMVASTSPLKRWGELEEIASAVVWLCSPGAGFVNGHTLVVDGGYLIQ